MHFQIDTNPDDVSGAPPTFTWRLVATMGTLCRSPESYASAVLARSAVAQFKRSASGIRYARVQEGPQDA